VEEGIRELESRSDPFGHGTIGARLADGVEMIARAIHPDAFK